MDKAIRREDGSMLPPGHIKAIKRSGQDIVSGLLALAPSGVKPTKKYLRNAFPKEWTLAIRAFEHEQPLLALCSSHWKASHLLGSMLQARKSEKQTGLKNESGDENDMEPPADEISNTASSTTKRKRSESSIAPAPPSPARPKPKKKKTDTTTSAGPIQSPPQTVESGATDVSTQDHADNSGQTKPNKKGKAKRKSMY